MYISVNLKTYSEHCQTYKEKVLVKIVNNRKPSNIFAQHSVLGVWQGYISWIYWNLRDEEDLLGIY